MSAPIRIGTATSRPGEITYGAFEAVPLPTGGADSLPVIIAQGPTRTGPVLWLTANIHGNEYDGIAVIHRLLTPELVRALSGTIVALPTLNPAGLRTGGRVPYYLYGKDPNRLFPGMAPDLTGRDHSAHSALEAAYGRLFERIDATADYLIDLHNYGIRSIPFAFLDPVYYRDPRDYRAAQRLQRTIEAMVAALGLTVVREYRSDQYLELNLHRSLSGATLNTARIPAITLELGGQNTLNRAHVAAALAGIRNVLRWADMLPGPHEPVTGVPVIAPGYPVRRVQHPRVPVACVVHPLVEPGQVVRAHEPVARMVDIYGRPAGTQDGLLCTEHEGFVLGLYPGITYYPNEPVMGLAIRDEGELVVPITMG